MLERILKFDRDLFIFLNGLGSETFDPLWLLITQKAAWIPVFAIILVLMYKNLGLKHSLLIIVLIAGLLTLTDQTTNLFKNHFQRLRPVNNPELENLIRIVQMRKSFSFFSGHASNSMAAAMMLFLILKPYVKHMRFIFIWPLIFAYSRIYLGLHYPSDIFCGYVYGAFWGYMFYQLYRYLRNRFFPKDKQYLDNPTNI